MPEHCCAKTKLQTFVRTFLIWSTSACVPFRVGSFHLELIQFSRTTHLTDFTLGTALLHCTQVLSNTPRQV